MRTIFRTFNEAKRYWHLLIFAIIAVIISTIAGFYTPLALRELTQLTTEGSQNISSHVMKIGLILLITTIVQSLGNSISGYLNHHAALYCVSDLRTRAYNKLQYMDLKYFHNNRTGDLTARIVNDTLQAEIIIAHIIPDFIVNMLTFIGIGFILFTINMKLALLSLATIPFLFIITLWQSKHLEPAWKENSKARGELSSVVQDNLSGIKEIQVFNQHEKEKSRIQGLSVKSAKAYLKAMLFNQITYPMLAFLTSLGTVLIIVYGGMLINSNKAEIADIVAFVMYIGMFYGPVKSYSQLTEASGEAIAGCRRVFEVIDEQNNIKEKPNAIQLSRVMGKIEFSNVSFGYNEKISVINDINFLIKPGQTLAVVGATGAGKTTIASLLNRFYDPQNGSILIDGTDIRDVTLKSLRSNISMVLQDTFLFSGTVYENIMYGQDSAAHEEVIEAAKAANAHSFIEDLENGYDTVVGERGVRLSGGQKQRISIARAILRNTPILILDEATSSLDSKTEKEIQSALDEISVGRTTIIIAHRLSTIRHADMIVVLEGTGIAEMGTHNKLIARDGIYARLHAAQAS